MHNRVLLGHHDQRYGKTKVWAHSLDQEFQSEAKSNNFDGLVFSVITTKILNSNVRDTAAA